VAKKSERSHLSRSKRKKSGIGSPPVAVQKKPVDQAVTTSEHTEVPAPVVAATGKSAAPTRSRYIHVSAELKRIGILAAIIFGVLGVLVVALP
jgi:hypothetical protein